MPDVQRNGQRIITTSATTAPVAGTVEVWSVSALSSGIRALATGETYSAVDATTGATSGQQAEIVRMTVCAGPGAVSVTVVRGVDGTTPVAHATTSTFNLITAAGSMPQTRWPSYAAAVTNYGLKNDYDQLRGIYNNKASNTRISDQGIGNAMLDNGGMTNVLAIGDSVTTGTVSGAGTVTFDRLHAWPLAMRNQMANIGVPGNGTGFIRHVDASNVDSRWSNVTGTWSGSNAYTNATTAGASATLNPDQSAYVYDYWYFDTVGATFTIAIDGAASGAGFKSVSTGGTLVWKYVRLYGVNIIGGFSKIVHTLTVVGTSGLIASGGSAWTPNAGMIVHNVAQGGSTAFGTGTTAWSDNTSLGLVYKDVAGRKRTVADAACTISSPNLDSATAVFTDNDLGTSVDQINLGAGGLMFPPGSFIGSRTSSTRVVMYQGIGAAAVPVNAYATLSAQSINIGRDPSAVHIALGGNDLQAGTTDAQMVTAHTTIRNVYPNSDCFTHLTHEFNPAVVSSAREATWQAAFYAMCDTLDVPGYDWRDRVGTYANGSANGTYGDNIAHLTAATSADLGAALAAILGGGSGRPQTSVLPVLDNDLVPKRYIDGRKAKSSSKQALTTVETVVLGPLPVPANGFKVDDVLKYAGWLVPAATTVTTVKVRIGPLGTTADTAVLTMSATAATNTAPRYIEGQVGITAIGATAAFFGGGTETVGAITAAGTVAAASPTFDSTVRNYVTVTVTNGTSTTTPIRGGTLEWV